MSQVWQGDELLLKCALEVLSRLVRVGRLDECWPYEGPNDWGMFLVDGWVRPHRLVFVAVHGPIPDGMVVDHTCHNRDRSCRDRKTCGHRLCCNPWHLRAATVGENTRAGRAHENRRRNCAAREVCSHGHALTGANRWVNSKGHLRCRRCYREGARRRQGYTPRGPLTEVVARDGAYDVLACGHSLRRGGGPRRPRRACRLCEQEMAESA